MVTTNQVTAKVFRIVLMAAAVIALLVIVTGSAVRVTEAGLACPDWPTCFGQFGLPGGEPAQLQYVHRVLSAIFVLISAASVFLIWRKRSGAPSEMERWVSRLALAGSASVILQAGLGGWMVISPAAQGLSFLHFILALASLGFFSGAVVTQFLAAGSGETLLQKFSLHTPFGRLVMAASLGLLVLISSGMLVANLEGGPGCAGWPLCSGGLPLSLSGWVEMGHRLLTLAGSVLITAQFVMAWKSQRSQTVQLSAATAGFVFLLGQIFLGALKVSRGYPPDLVGLHAASTAGLWAAQVVLLFAAGWSARTVEEESLEAHQPLPIRARLKDFFILSKPIIVLLLLVTTYAGMVVAAKKLPEFGLFFWTMLGGALAAGGSSAINQYIDRDLDKKMQRTARRPLPDGRLMPAEGLAYGLGAVLLAFFLLAGFVNLLAAVLSLLGAVYYVLLYSIWLKRLNEQNIVIGGGAGAIPPLVGWAAATGSLSVPAAFLFMIIFLWTPPHFWALALVRQKDYARAGIPMLPVTKGERAAQVQIFIYTLELVAVTLLMPVFKMAGAFYLVAAAALGGWLIFTAWRVLNKGGNKTAWLMYRYSSMYLAFLFLALVIDALI